MKIVIDSDILIEVSRGRDAVIVSKWVELCESANLLLFSPITAAEVWAGARAAEYAMLEALFDVLTCVPTDAAIGRRAGEYLRRHQKSHGLELGDALIGASAATLGANLWTRNRRHYPMRELQFFE